LFLLGLPTPTGHPSERRQPGRTFTWTGDPSGDFLTGLQYPAPVTLESSSHWWIGLTAVIDYVGRIDLNGVPLSGEQSVAVLKCWSKTVSRAFHRNGCWRRSSPEPALSDLLRTSHP
jgi:hypothetical protein